MSHVTILSLLVNLRVSPGQVHFVMLGYLDMKPGLTNRNRNRKYSNGHVTFSASAVFIALHTNVR